MTNYFPGTWERRMLIAPIFKTYLVPVKKDASDRKILNKITQDCMTVLTDYFSIDEKVEITTYHDSKLFSEQSRKFANPGNIIWNRVDTALDIYLKPDPSKKAEDKVLFIVESIVRSIIQYLNPEVNEATLHYYTLVIMFENIFKIRVSKEEKNQVYTKIEKSLGQKIEELYIPEKEGISLTCPFCRSDHLESLGLQSLGKFEVKGGIPILNANHEDQLLMAYYRCKNCNRVFYFVPEKVEGK